MRCTFMKKPYKVLSTAALATVFASSALVPVIAQAEETQIQAAIDSVLVEKDGKVFELDFFLFNELVGEGETFDIKYVKAGGKTFTPAQFNEAFGEASTISEVADLLANAGLYEPTEVTVDGTVEINENGELVFTETPDETPEENLNETFFYNLAA